MTFNHILITGGAGFVGSNLCVRLRAAFPDVRVTAFDNLMRRGSELNLERLQAANVTFVRGDIRVPPELDAVGPFDLMIECSAEPSVQAGLDNPKELVDINFNGAVNCLEAARKNKAAVLFISTSRVYPIEPINALPWRETDSRYEWTDVTGIAESFPMDGRRSIYGTTKLAAELLIAEYVHHFEMPCLINRCGVLAGPWQMGRVDQGVVTLWVARHRFQLELAYIGWGGIGKQVRDVLHVDDLFELLELQLARPEIWDGRVYNVGGGTDSSASLLELTKLCRDITGNTVEIGSRPETSDVDVRLYITDYNKASAELGWQPTRDMPTIAADINQWLTDNEALLRPIFVPH
jgi:CDP-paratose 2-epimerase